MNPSAYFQPQRRTLHVYRASAGSGKTHLLTGFYIRQLFAPSVRLDDEEDHLLFCEILAVTFTNKATAEMKGRIIDELYLLSEKPEASDYWQEVNPQGLPPEKISRKADLLLRHILNDYAQFNISTIDSFFQKILRSFARELNVSGNYEIELDAYKVLDASVSSFLQNLDQREQRDVFNWMLLFSRQRIEDGQGWDFRNQLLQMSRVLTTEKYQLHRQAIAAFTDDKPAMKAYAQMLRTIINGWKKRLRELGEEVMSLMEQMGLTADDFKYNGKGYITLMKTWSEGGMADVKSNMLRAAEDLRSLVKHPVNNEAGIDRLQKLMTEGVVHATGDPYRQYISALAIQANFYELGILAHLDQEVTNYCNDHNSMLLSSTTEMLHQLIGENDSPFIYEKTGTRIKSYMIDEFQDTSGMQWDNFRPLLSDSLADGHQNLIVGDVKQSIYRWRGGDWGLLHSELDSYEPLHHDDQERQQNTLKTNYRSLEHLVEFNNTFFAYMAEQQDKLTHSDQVSLIYSDVAQELPKPKSGFPEKPKGLVHVSFLHPTDKEGNPIEKPSAADKVDEAIRQLPLQVIRLQENGFEPRDIAVLCRYKNECQLCASALLTYRQEHPDCPYSMDIISGEALSLSARPSIQTLVSLLQHLQSPDSALLSVMAWTNYYQLEGLTPDESLSRYFAKPSDERAFCPELLTRPLYEMVEQLISHLPADVQSAEAPFLQAFRDLVLDFTSSRSADLAAFLDWWNESGQNKSITTTEEQNAIRIMTIHQSKGLGMPAVIIPFASWQMNIDTSHGEIIWCEPKEEPFSRDVLLPIRLSPLLEKTIFAADYQEERLRQIIDNLNVAYVAFTRAKEALVIMAPLPGSGKNSDTCLESYLYNFTGHEDVYEQGEWLRAAKPLPDRDKGAKVLAPLRYSGYKQLPQLSILHSPLVKEREAIRRGNCIHRVLQEISDIDHAHDEIKSLFCRGVIDSEVISLQDMLLEVDRLLEDKLIRSWFAPGLTVLNEQTLMTNANECLRPDRVIILPDGSATVIDYKSGSDHEGYRPQVARYMRQLQLIGFKRVRGYLLFLRNNRVVEVH